MTVANGIPALRPHLSLGVLVSPVQDQAVTCRYRKVSKIIYFSEKVAKCII